MSRRPTEENWDKATPQDIPKWKRVWKKFKRMIGQDGLIAIILGLFTTALTFQIVGVMSLPTLVAIGLLAIALIFISSRGD